MNDFGKTLLEKYGWTEGKGLGKNENGMAEALKPKLKFDTAGISYNAAQDFSNHWWESVFNDAVKNVAIDSDAGNVSIKAIDEDRVSIGTGKLSSRVAEGKCTLQYGSFLKTSTLLNDGTVVTEKGFEKSVDQESKEDTLSLKLPDEVLFKACGGRTAHKGARHGLALSGKLARIAQQEKELLAASAKSDVADHVVKDSVIRMGVTENRKLKQNSIRSKRHKERVYKETSLETDDNENTILSMHRQSVAFTNTVESSSVGKLKKWRDKTEQVGNLIRKVDDISKTSAKPIPDWSCKTDNVRVKEKKILRFKRKRCREGKTKDVDLAKNNAQPVPSSVAIEEIPLPMETNRLLRRENEVNAQKVVERRNDVLNGKHVESDTSQTSSSSPIVSITKRIKSKRIKHKNRKDCTSNAHKLQAESKVLPLANDTSFLKTLKRPRPDEDKVKVLTQQLNDVCVIDKTTISLKKRKIETRRSTEDLSSTEIDALLPSSQHRDFLLNNSRSKKSLRRSNRKKKKILGYRLKKKQKKKVELLIQDFMAVSLKAPSKEDNADNINSDDTKLND